MRASDSLPKLSSSHTGEVGGEDPADARADHKLELMRVAVEKMALQIQALVTPSPSPRLLTKKRAGAMLGVGRTRTLQRLIDTGVLPTVTVGKRVRIRLADIERLLAEGEPAETQPPSAPKSPRHPVTRQSLRPANLVDQLAQVRKMRI